MHKKFAALLCAIVVLFSSTGSLALQLSFVPPSSPLNNIGEVARIKLVVSDLPSDKALGAFDLHVLFDPLRFAFRPELSMLGEIGAGDPMNFSGFDLEGFGLAGIEGQDDPFDPIIRLFKISLEPAAALLANQPKQFTLATLSFEAIGVGVRQLFILPATDSFQTSLSDHDGSAFDEVHTRAGRVGIDAPPSLALCLALGCSLVLVRRDVITRLR